MSEKWRKYGKVRKYTTIPNPGTGRTSDRPGGLYKSSPARLLSTKNIRQNKKPIIYQGDMQCGEYKKVY